MNGQKIVYSPVSLWKNFDCETLPLNVEAVEQTAEEGLIYTHVFFNGIQYEDGTSRIFGLFVHKDVKSKMPALILLGGLGRSFNRAEATYWAKKGYAVLLFDNMGEKEGERYTLYPQSVKYANYVYAERHLTNCDTNAKETTWYHWAANTRRAITFLRSQNCVDKRSIGIISSKDMSFAACMVAAFETRLAACAVMFGTCYQDVEITEARQSDQIERAEERERWFAGVAPQSYLMHMSTPFFLCVAANYNQTDLDKTCEAMKLIPKDTTWAMWIANRLPDAGGEYFVKNLEKWLAMHLKRQEEPVKVPSTSFRVINGKLNVIVRVPDDDKTQDVVVYVAREASKPSVRNWTKTALQKLADGVYRAEVDVFDNKQSCYAFCNLRYKGGLVLSGNMAQIDPEALGNVRLAKRTKTIFNDSMGMGTFKIYDPLGGAEATFNRNRSLKIESGPNGIKGICGRDFATFALNDAKFVKSEDSVLVFDVFSKEPQDLCVTIVSDYGQEQQKEYEVNKKLLGGELWQKICVTLSELKSRKGRTPAGWEDCEVLCFGSQQDIILNNLVLS